MTYCWILYLFVVLLPSPANAGLFKRPLIDPDPVGKELTKKVDASDEEKVPDERAPMMAPNPPPKPRQPPVASKPTPKPTPIQMEGDTWQVQRKTNQVRVTLINVDGISVLSPAETMFFEDCFIAAFVESQNNGNDTDINVRSMIVLLDESLKKKKRLRGSERSLWSAPGGYFDISAMFEWSCHLCGGSSRSESGSRTFADDDNRDDDFYYNGPGKGQRRPGPAPKARPTRPSRSRPTPPPKARPTRAKRSMLDDDFTHADDYSVRGGNNRYHKGALDNDDDDYSNNETIGSSDATTSPTNDGDMVDDDVFSVFFGKRVLEESDERHFEELLCDKLRAGPFQAFHRVRDCFVVFTA